MFSVINSESVERMKFYSGSFPAEAGNALSGALFIQSRDPLKDSTHVHTDISLFKGNGYVSSPLMKNRLAAYACFQDLWYDYTVKKLMDTFVSDSAFEIEMEEYKKYVNLPNLRDWQYGLSFKPGKNLSFQYNGLSAGDRFNVTIPKQRNIFRKREVVPVWPPKPVPTDNLKQAQKLGLDSLSFVALNNQVHQINFTSVLSGNLCMNAAASAQWQTWDVAFANREDGEAALAPVSSPPLPWYRGVSAKDFRLDKFQNSFQFHQQMMYTGIENHRQKQTKKPPPNSNKNR